MAMLESLSGIGSRSKEAPSGSGGSALAALVLRVGGGLVLLVQYALSASLRAWHFLWEHAPWPLVDAMVKNGMSWAKIGLPLAAVIALAVSLAWILGFLTRFFSASALVLFAVTSMYLSKADQDQHFLVIVLLTIIALALLCVGSGPLSVDGLFKALSASKKKPSRY